MNAFKLVLFVIVSLVVAACSTSSTSVQVDKIKCKFVAPESCARIDDGDRHGWIVSDQGCGFDQPCQADSPSTRGSLILATDDGKCETITKGLQKPNGVDVDSDGTVWWVDQKGVHALLSDGSQRTIAIQGAKLLNDVAVIPGQSGVIVSDSLTGKLHAVALVHSGIVTSEYTSFTDGPNGVAFNDDKLAVVSLGDFKLPGKSGVMTKVTEDSDRDDGCGQWHAGPASKMTTPPNRKWDGVVPWGKGWIASAIYDNSKAKLTTELWYFEEGQEPKMVFDAAKYGLNSAADIGIDPKTNNVCIPDLNVAKGMKENGETGASPGLIIVRGLGSVIDR